MHFAAASAAAAAAAACGGQHASRHRHSGGDSLATAWLPQHIAWQDAVGFGGGAVQGSATRWGCNGSWRWHEWCNPRRGRCQRHCWWNGRRHHWWPGGWHGQLPTAAGDPGFAHGRRGAGHSSAGVASGSAGRRPALGRPATTFEICRTSPSADKIGDRSCRPSGSRCDQPRGCLSEHRTCHSRSRTAACGISTWAQHQLLIQSKSRLCPPGLCRKQRRRDHAN
mmetsp:Transcript_51343/g.119336  ORF Transcript_51343/g.119336 Transcript_51343/m.119336 type:complete len:224 (-) Transcript_51343:89-760(-)